MNRPPDHGSRACAPKIPHGLVFHRFREEAGVAGGQGSLTERDLEELIRSVGPSSFLSPAQWVTRLHRGTLRDEDRCLTFDDGLLCQYRVALPVLDKFGLKAFWFIYSSVFEGLPDRNELSQYFAARWFGAFSDYVREFLSRCPQALRDELERPGFRRFADDLQRTAGFYSEADLAYRFVRNRLLKQDEFGRIIDAMLQDRGLAANDLIRDVWLTDDHLKVLSREGHWIGLHSYDHPFELARLTLNEQRRQFERNYGHILRVTGSKPRSMSHPLNSYDERTLEVLAGLGIECGFRDDLLPPPGKTLNPGPLELSRMDAVHLLQRTTTP